MPPLRLAQRGARGLSDRSREMMTFKHPQSLEFCGGFANQP
jgi:hypothetical protein